MIQDKMDFSMYIKNFFILCLIILTAGCATKQQEWRSEYGTTETRAPTEIMYGSPYVKIGSPADNMDGAPVRKIAVLLPLSGENEKVGDTIRTSIETAVLQNAPQNLSVSFYDSSDGINVKMPDILAENPEIVIGPVFSQDARILRSIKPESLPVLSFTSDANSIGNGIMTMALMPTNSIEAIVKEMINDKVRNFVIIAPDTESGKLMAGTALSASEIYNIPTVGIFFYKENDSESIKTTAEKASMNAARVAANNRAREILSDIITQERLTAVEKSSLNTQLNRLSKSDTLGNAPYDAVLFLGDGNDTKTIASFLRYYGVGARDARFYGTALWEGSDIATDFTMQGAKYATLPEISPMFSNIYEQMSGQAPNRLATFGYDATNMAIGMIYSNKSDAAYLLDPSGYVGIDGLFRLKPAGESERALRIVQITNTGTTEVVRNAPQNFIAPVYNIEQHKVKPASAMDLETSGINPNDYINIPERLRSKYKSKTYGTHITLEQEQPKQENIIILPEDDSDPIISPDFQPVSLESVNKTYIDSVEIEE